MSYHIRAKSFDHRARELASADVPVRFSSREQAERFMRAYLQHAFADGASGYDMTAKAWWGCAGDSELMLERFTIEYRDSVALAEPALA